jgi:hypothetical protein
METNMHQMRSRRWIAALVLAAAAAALAVAPAPTSAQSPVTTAAKGPGHCC